MTTKNISEINSMTNVQKLIIAQRELISAFTPYLEGYIHKSDELLIKNIRKRISKLEQKIIKEEHYEREI